MKPAVTKTSLSKPTASLSAVAYKKAATAAATTITLETSLKTTPVPKKRTAHTTSYNRKPTGPPTILPDTKASISLKVRQLIADKLFEAFARIYEPIISNNPMLATEHAKQQEERILNATKNVAGYKQMAMSTLMNLKKRSVSKDDEDIGLDGDWIDREKASAEKALIFTRAKECVASLEELKQLEYPLPDLLEAQVSLIEKEEIIGTIQKCDRCKDEYLVKAVLDKDDLASCVYHPSRPYIDKVNGQKEKIYGCCKDSLGSEGCTRGPHVYKDEDLVILHRKIPFVKTPPRDPASKSNKILDLIALDCEMGYTTAGMELIRLTAVDKDLNVLIDELVLPSSMVIDLNTSYSGVKTLEGVKYDLDGLRKELFKYVDEETIIVGHGLENDFNALRVIHTNVIDTVVLFPHRQGLPYRQSLRKLTSTHLKRFIQTGSDGHDSLEDASACIELLELYIKKMLDKVKAKKNS
ncbi:MAG: ribonuclease H-like domain-containing protein [Benjaminiella poitrasii]|nr:MAG: ribonuclease H-like domain-containing protein [Benjaminiella poitrasii]